MLEDWRIITAVLGGLTALLAAAVWVGRMTEFKSATTHVLEEIREDVKKIFDRLPPAAVASGSPLRLTDLGEKVSKELNAREWASEVIEKEGLTGAGKLPYEVQELCQDYLQGRFHPEPEQESLLKQVAYENGIDQEQVLNVLMVVLRDLLLET